MLWWIITILTICLMFKTIIAIIILHWIMCYRMRYRRYNSMSQWPCQCMDGTPWNRGFSSERQVYDSTGGSSCCSSLYPIYNFYKYHMNALTTSFFHCNVPFIFITNVSIMCLLMCWCAPPFFFNFFFLQSAKKLKQQN